MVEQVEVLKERYESLEKRKRHEVSGYQSDIRILRQKVRQVEQQLIRASLAKAKGMYTYLQCVSLDFPQFRYGISS